MGAKGDFIFLEGLQTHCVIGIFGWERNVKQKIWIDLKVPTDAGRAARRDRIEDTLNYKDVAKFLHREIPKTRFRLVESLAEYIANRCLDKFGLKTITVRISKPGAIRRAKNVGVEVTRQKRPGLKRFSFP